MRLDGVAKLRSPPCVDPIAAVFRNLDRWRHLPSYQLERRADIFFSVYLRGLLQEITGDELEEDILPELPLKRDVVVDIDGTSDQSVKVDYALFTKDRSKVYFVELKTDPGSVNEKQLRYLRKAKERGFHKIVDGFRSILLKTNAHQKYHHLATALERLGYLQIPIDLRDYLYPRVRPGLTKRLRHVETTGINSAVEIVFVLPDGATVIDGARCIGFDAVADYARRFDDPVSRTFAEHLAKWKAAAGSEAP